MAHAGLVKRYTELRNLGRNLNTEIVKSLSKRAMMEGGRRLGVARGNRFVLDTEDEIAVVMDYCIHDLRHDRQNALDRFLVSPREELSPEQSGYLISLAKSFYSLFEIRDAEADVGLNAFDLVQGENYFIYDVGFSNTARPGSVFATRIFTHDGITMTTGAALPVPEMKVHPLIQKIKTAKSDGLERTTLPYKVTAEIIRELLLAGAASRVQYQDVPLDMERGVLGQH
jgi:hypothetical protein